MITTWINQALAAGGTLEVKAVLPGKSIFRAVMDWPGEIPVAGKIAMSAETALDNLECALAIDAGDEMLRTGRV